MKTKSRAPLIIAVCAIILTAIVAVSVLTRLDKLETTKTVGNTFAEYTVGKLSDETGKTMSDDEKEAFGGAYNQYMSLKEYVNPDGLKIKLEKDAKVKYKVYFYDENYDLVVAFDEFVNEDFNAADYVAETSAASTIKYARVEIFALGDADNKISTTEISKYAKQLTITYNKFE